MQVNSVKLARFLAGERRKRRMNQGAFAELLQIRQQDVSRFENPQTAPKRSSGKIKRKIVAKLPEICGMSEEQLYAKIGGQEPEILVGSIENLVTPVPTARS